MLKRISGIFIILSSVLIFGCGNGGGNSANTTAAPTTVYENPGDIIDNGNNTDESAAREKSSLPEEMDFSGREFRVITRNVERIYEEFAVEEETGDPIIDALYKRNLRIEEKYNTVIKQTNVSDPSSVISKAVKAGDYSYELIIDTMANIRNLASQSALLDLYKVPYISDDLSKPWWNQALKRDLSINGKLYFQSGDIVMKDKLRMAVMYFNKDMFQTLGLEYPYKYVYDGTWTIDKLSEITKGVNFDLNGDGIMDQYDRWGFMAQHEASFHFYAAAGERTVTLNKDGVPEITMNTPRSMEVIQKVLDICTDGVTMFHADKIKGADNVWLTASAYFQEDRFLMRSSVFEPIVRDLRAMPTDFGLLPYVKFDEKQENYYSWVEISGYYLGIPNNADESFAGFITESLAYESGDTLMPAFYDLCLRSKVLRDNESEGMLDIIFNSKVYDIGYIYGIGELSSVLSNMTSSGNTDFTSRYERISGAAERALQKFIDSYDSE